MHFYSYAKKPLPRWNTSLQRLTTVLFIWWQIYSDLPSFSHLILPDHGHTRSGYLSRFGEQSILWDMCVNCHQTKHQNHNLGLISTIQSTELNDHRYANWEGLWKWNRCTCILVRISIMLRAENLDSVIKFLSQKKSQKPHTHRE